MITIHDARAAFAGGRDYLAACTLGLPTRATRAAIVADLDAAGAGRPDLAAYTAAVERTRDAYARLVRVAPSRVAIGSQTSVLAGLVAASLADGAEVLCVEGDFASLVAPFAHAGRGIRVRAVPLDELASAVSSETALVAFSLVQSATGQVADAAAISRAAAGIGALTLCDTTQAVGWLPVDAAEFDITVCHAYKWLCSPRGVAFLTISPEAAASVPAVFAGWYAGADPWTTCYGHDVVLADDASRFDVSPAWQAFVGADPALELFAALDRDAVHAHATGLATRFIAASGRAAASVDATPSAIVTWSDPDGADLARLASAGIVASGRAGRARVSFHVFNDDRDVDHAVAALRA
ncbi:aminotransferase class V-fold PLP-dependent enzyme [Microbacterium sp. CJ88]|uniref:aminotransferase class V-fold PLP-dependent enzyme n=1 Tax=Microbacterium sp. CJ88 TaxID=3445672 RepID=UPI003F65723F